MSSKSIRFFSEDTDFTLKGKDKTRTWVIKVCKEENHSIRDLNIVFCSDKYLLSMNQEYLQHDTFTDIITFDNSENPDQLEGDIFISIDRVRENANKFQTDVSTELLRVIIHGVLHLMGYKDKSEKDKLAMRKKEDACLSLF
ncbi:MAG: rRNA maturation RNase YbeY [Cytophagaceae bacterium]